MCLELPSYISSKNSRKVTSTFLNLVELETCTVDAIVDVLRQELSNIKLDLARLIAIGTGNVNVMAQINNGVFAELKKKFLTSRCLCHFL